jgi:signal transduction histidine kinase/DNA-binding response OmpR family regulator
MIGVCGLTYALKSYHLNFACFFLMFCLGLIAVQMSLITSYTNILYLIPCTIIIGNILLPIYWSLGLALLNTSFVFAFTHAEDAAFIVIAIWINMLMITLFKNYFINELKIREDFQDYATEQMKIARESRAKLVLMSNQLQEYQDRLRVINKKLEIAFENAEESRQLKARFAANVSHELRTPINLIVGFSEVMILAPEVYNQPLPSPYRADIHAIYRNAKHLQNLINDVLDISQLEARHLAIVKQKANLRDCIQETANMVSDLIAKKGLDFFLNIPNSLPDLWFDPLRIRQILLNLLVNAVRFTSDGSITIEIQVDEHQVITSVIDTGLGLSASDIKHVFEEFYQVDTNNSSLNKGSGLGLTLSQELIKLHGGAMTVTSDGVPYKGSSFSFSLPTTKKLVSQMPTRNDISGKSTDEKRILIVDGDEAITNFFSRYLKSHNVEACTHEKDALQMITEFKPDFLLLAHDHSYHKLLNKIKHYNILVTIITLPMPSGRTAVQQYGVSEYLVKPVSREMLNKVIAKFETDIQTIMIIDDNRDIVRLFSQTLRSLSTDYTIRTAYGGKDGILMMNQFPPDLVLLDVLMPEIDGFAVIDYMQKNETLKHIPIILISAKGASESITPIIFGDITLIRKSGYSPIELVNSVQSLIDGIRPPIDLRLTKTRLA